MKPFNLSQFENAFGYQLWESFADFDTHNLGRVLDELFPPTVLPDGQVRRSFVYTEPARDIRPFLNQSDFLWRSAEVQRRIFEHQNPPICANRTFMKIESAWPYGFGALMRVAASHLARAIDADRILIYPEVFDTVWVKDPVCGNPATPDCYFLPLSNCTPGPASDIVSSHHDKWLRDYAPLFVQKMLNGSIVEPTSYYYYWTAHAWAYMTRLNNRTEVLVRQIMNKSGILPIWETTGFDVAIHVRHGDKRREMALVGNEHYTNVLNLVQKLQPGNLTVFLASDDPQSFEFFARRKDIKLFAIRTPYLDELHYKSGLYVLADVWASMRTKFMIGTWTSNFDNWVKTLIDVVAGHASVPFFEVGQRPCFSSAHCKSLHRRCIVWHGL
jgi:hypothetical protein